MPRNRYSIHPHGPKPVNKFPQEFIARMLELAGLGYPAESIADELNKQFKYGVDRHYVRCSIYRLRREGKTDVSVEGTVERKRDVFGNPIMEHGGYPTDIPEFDREDAPIPFGKHRLGQCKYPGNDGSQGLVCGAVAVVRSRNEVTGVPTAWLPYCPKHCLVCYRPDPRKGGRRFRSAA